MMILPRVWPPALVDQPQRFEAFDAGLQDAKPLVVVRDTLEGKGVALDIYAASP